MYDSSSTGYRVLHTNHYTLHGPGLGWPCRRITVTGERHDHEPRDRMRIEGRSPDIPVAPGVNPANRDRMDQPIPQDGIGHSMVRGSPTTANRIRIGGNAMQGRDVGTRCIASLHDRANKFNRSRRTGSDSVGDDADWPIRWVVGVTPTTATRQLSRLSKLSQPSKQNRVAPHLPGDPA